MDTFTGDLHYHHHKSGKQQQQQQQQQQQHDTEATFCRSFVELFNLSPHLFSESTVVRLRVHDSS